MTFHVKACLAKVVINRFHLYFMICTPSLTNSISHRSTQTCPPIHFEPSWIVLLIKKRPLSLTMTRMTCTYIHFTFAMTYSIIKNATIKHYLLQWNASVQSLRTNKIAYALDTCASFLVFFRLTEIYTRSFVDGYTRTRTHLALYSNLIQ